MKQKPIFDKATVNSQHTPLKACFVYFLVLFLSQFLVGLNQLKGKQKCFNLSALITLQSLTIGFGSRYKFLTQT